MSDTNQTKRCVSTTRQVEKERLHASIKLFLICFNVWLHDHVRFLEADEGCLNTPLDAAAFFHVYTFLVAPKNDKRRIGECKNITSD